MFNRLVVSTPIRRYETKAEVTNRMYLLTTTTKKKKKIVRKTIRFGFTRLTIIIIMLCEL